MIGIFGAGEDRRSIRIGLGDIAVHIGTETDNRIGDRIAVLISNQNSIRMFLAGRRCIKPGYDRLMTEKLVEILGIHFGGGTFDRIAENRSVLIHKVSCRRAGPWQCIVKGFGIGKIPCETVILFDNVDRFTGQFRIFCICAVSYDTDVFARILLCELVYFREFTDSGTAPGSPDIDHRDVALCKELL